MVTAAAAASLTGDHAQTIALALLAFLTAALSAWQAWQAKGAARDAAANAQAATDKGEDNKQAIQAVDVKVDGNLKQFIERVAQLTEALHAGGVAVPATPQAALRDAGEVIADLETTGGAHEAAGAGDSLGNRPAVQPPAPGARSVPGPAASPLAGGAPPASPPA